MPWIWKSWTVPLSFVSSEFCFLPRLLNINDTQNNARKGAGVAPDVISGCRRTNSRAWTGAWPETKVPFKTLSLSFLFVIWTHSERFDSVLMRFFSNQHTRIYKSKRVLSPLKSICPLRWLQHCSPRIWKFSCGVASDCSHPRLAFESEMTSSSWVTHRLLPDLAPNDLELISKVEICFQRTQWRLLKKDS